MAAITTPDAAAGNPPGQADHPGKPCDGGDSGRRVAGPKPGARARRLVIGRITSGQGKGAGYTGRG